MNTEEEEPIKLIELHPNLLSVNGGELSNVNVNKKTRRKMPSQSQINNSNSGNGINSGSNDLRMTKKKILHKLKRFRDKYSSIIDNNDSNFITASNQDFCFSDTANAASEFEKTLDFFKQQQPVFSPAVTALTSAVLPLLPPPPPTETTINLNIKPQYGCLKNGSLPTYRNWKNEFKTGATSVKNRNSYMPAAVATATATIPPPPLTPDYTLPEIEDDNISLQLHPQSVLPNYSHPPQKQCKIIKRHYTIGKSKKHPKIAVLISNKTMRKKINTEKLNYGQKSITDIKKYLQKKGLIKVGTITPNEILRQMYEAVKLTGDIVNHNKETLLYNYLNSNTNTENSTSTETSNKTL